MTIVKHKRGTGIPSPDDIEVGEIAIDTSTGTAYTKAGDGGVVPVGGDSSGGDGAGMVIQPDEPADPVTGMQWMDSTTGRIWIWDDDKWLEFPAGCGSGGGSGGGSEWELVDSVDMSGASAYEYYGFELGVKQYRLSIPLAYSPTEYRYAIECYEGMQDTVVDLGKSWTNVKMWPDNAMLTGQLKDYIAMPNEAGHSGDSRSEVIFSGMDNTSGDRVVRVTYQHWQGDKYFTHSWHMAADDGKQFNGFRLSVSRGTPPINSEARLYKLAERV